jgi:hypothetical protein
MKPSNQDDGGYSLTHPLVIITGIALLGAIGALIVAAQQPANLATTLLSNVIVFIASGLLSYFITFANNRKVFLKEIEKLATFSRRRVDLLSESLLSLAQEVGNIPTAHEAKRIVVYTLRNLEQDARASVRDIEGLGGIAFDDEPLMSPEQPADASPVSGETTVSYNCVACGYSNSANLDLVAGSTRQVSCGNCRRTLNLHRLRDGGYRVVNPARSRLSDFASTSPISDQQPDSPEPAAPPAASPVKESFACPRCQNRVTFSALPSQRFIEKPCFSCMTVSSYDRARSVARLVPDKKPLYIESLEVEQIDCTVCGVVFKPRLFSTADELRLACCFNCNTIYLEEKNRKRIEKKSCPSQGCGNVVSFKVSDGQQFAPQVCLECQCRLSYDVVSDEVYVAEKLDIPRVARDQFIADGQRCPHCTQPTSAGFSRNSCGQSLSICWGCKNVFEFI